MQIALYRVFENKNYLLNNYDEKLSKDRSDWSCSWVQKEKQISNKNHLS